MTADIKRKNLRVLLGLAALATAVLLLVLGPGPLPAAGPPDNARLAQVKKRVEKGLRQRVEKEGFAWGAPVFLRIFKERGRPGDYGESGVLEAWLHDGKRFSLYKTYPVCRFSGDPGPKLRVGDNQAPEGFYFVTPLQMNPASRFHLSFNLGYPNAYDRARGRSGSALMVHGSCVSIGCFAMTNPGIEEIYLLADAALRAGQPFFRVHVFPFALTDEALEKYKKSRWLSFWENLKEGYEAFERDHVPPDAGVKNKEYVFTSGLKGE